MSLSRQGMITDLKILVESAFIFCLETEEQNCKVIFEKEEFRANAERFIYLKSHKLND